MQRQGANGGGRRRTWPITLAAVVVLVAPLHATDQPAARPPPASASPAAGASDADDLYELGRQLFDTYAPPEVKAEYAFPTKEQWDAFLPTLQAALQNDSLEDLARYAPQARAALAAMRTLAIDADVADWLEQRLDETEAARQAPQWRPSPMRPAPEPAPSRPGTVAPPRRPGLPPAAVRVPYYEFWSARVKARPVPPRAAELMPKLRQAFAAEGVPPAVAWLAEAESSFNPSARSPAGAKGLFQLMPETAHRLGLATFLPDERSNPEKSARAAARYLRELHEKFGEWPLAFAAYNAGEGRVARALAARQGRDYAAIADALPAETRMYVPKVCALIALRAGVPITAL